VSLSCATPGAKIYYSTDDSTPSFTDEHLYVKPFTIKKGMVVKAIAKIYGKDNSGLAVLELHDTRQPAR
jgi:beta-glucosidase